MPLIVRFWNETEVSDAGLEHLKALTKLGRLELTKTKVTNAGVEKLQQALPNCMISHSLGSRDNKPYNFRSSPAYNALTAEERQGLEQVHRDFVLLWGPWTYSRKRILTKFPRGSKTWCRCT